MERLDREYPPPKSLDVVSEYGRPERAYLLRRELWFSVRQGHRSIRWSPSAQSSPGAMACVEFSYPNAWIGIQPTGFFRECRPTPKGPISNRLLATIEGLASECRSFLETASGFWGLKLSKLGRHHGELELNLGWAWGLGMGGQALGGGGGFRHVPPPAAPPQCARLVGSFHTDKFPTSKLALAQNLDPASSITDTSPSPNGLAPALSTTRAD